MKKLISILLVISMLLSAVLFASCANNTAGGTTNGGEVGKKQDASADDKDQNTTGGNGDGTTGDGAHTHAYGEWSVVTAASCKSTGTSERTCACGEKETVTTPITPHDFKDNVCKTCAKEASTGFTFHVNDDKSGYILTGLGECTDTEILIPSRTKTNP